MGFDFNMGNSYRIASAFSNLADQNHFDKTFSFWFNTTNGREAEEDQGGKLFLGDVNPNYYSGDINYVNVTSDDRGMRTQWTFTLDAVSMDGCAFARNATAIPDTGTSLLAMPSRIADEMNQRIGASKEPQSHLSVVDCDSVASMSDVVLHINGVAHTLKPEDYIIRFQNQCVSGFMGFDFPDMDVWILGNVFLRVVCLSS